MTGTVQKYSPVLALALPGVFFGLVLALHPFGSVFEYDPDEGYNTIKALLLGKGYALYTAVWSDQPPVFTYVLAGWFTVTDASVFQGRLFVLLWSVVLLSALYQTIRLTWGHCHAVCGCGLLLLSQHYLNLSVSIMLGLPALALALGAVLTATLYVQTQRAVWLGVSAGLLAVAVLTKLLSLLLAPALIVYLSWVPVRHDGRPHLTIRLSPAVVWSGVFVTTLAGLAFALVPAEGVSQLIVSHLPHLGTYQKGSLGQGWLAVRDWLQQDWDIVMAATFGVLLLRRSTRDLILPLTWLILSGLVFINHTPVWYHHVLFFSIPACWLAGIVLGEGMTGLARHGWEKPSTDLRPGLRSGLAYWGGLVAWGCVVVMLPTKYERLVQTRVPQHNGCDQYLSAVLRALAPATRFVLTDRQLLAFSAGLPVPPQLAVTSLKRRRADQLTGAQVLTALDTYQPEQVFFSSRSYRGIPWTGDLIASLQTHYTLVFDNSLGRYFVLPSLAAQASRAASALAAHFPACAVVQTPINEAVQPVQSGQAEILIRSCCKTVASAGRPRREGPRNRNVRRVHEDFEAPSNAGIPSAVGLTMASQE